MNLNQKWLTFHAIIIGLGLTLIQDNPVKVYTIHLYVSKGFQFSSTNGTEEPKAVWI